MVEPFSIGGYEPDVAIDTLKCGIAGGEEISIGDEAIGFVPSDFALEVGFAGDLPVADRNCFGVEQGASIFIRMAFADGV